MALHMSLQLGGELRIKIADFTCCVLCSALLHIFGLRKGCFTDAASLVLLSDVIFQGKVASKRLFATLTKLWNLSFVARPEILFPVLISFPKGVLLQ